MKRYSIGMAIMASALLFVGAGVSAVFTDQGTATETIKVGSSGSS
jgi:predicted ribosomally synthesized peptide with SipW-like signal peptide